MLKLDIKAKTLFNESTDEFITVEPQTLILEHSLLSISKWEQKWHKPFLNNKDKNREEDLDYFRCMTVSPKDVDPLLYLSLDNEEINKIREYIEDPHTATTVHRRNKGNGRNDVITAELVYCWMFMLDIPWEFEKRNFNWLLMLIEVCDIKSGGGGKMSRKDNMMEMSRLNDIRRAKLGTKG